MLLNNTTSKLADRFYLLVQNTVRVVRVHKLQAVVLCAVAKNPSFIQLRFSKDREFNSAAQILEKPTSHSSDVCR